MLSIKPKGFEGFWGQNFRIFVLTQYQVVLVAILTTAKITKKKTHHLKVLLKLE